MHKEQTDRPTEQAGRQAGRGSEAADLRARRPRASVRPYALRACVLMSVDVIALATKKLVAMR